MSKNFDAVIFDFDGTIADTGKGIFHCIKYALHECGLEPISDESLRTFIGPPLHDSFKRECGTDDETTSLLVSKYRECYAREGIYEFDMYDGMTELLKTLRQNGILTGIASSKPENFINMILKNTHLEDLFDFTSGSDPRYIDSDKTSIVKACIKKMNLKKSAKYLMVGDRCFDIIGAHNAGIPCAAVLFGYGSLGEFKQYKADYIAAGTDDLKRIIINK